MSWGMTSVVLSRSHAASNVQPPRRSRTSFSRSCTATGMWRCARRCSYRTLSATPVPGTGQHDPARPGGNSSPGSTGGVGRAGPDESRNVSGRIDTARPGAQATTDSSPPRAVRVEADQPPIDLDAPQVVLVHEGAGDDLRPHPQPPLRHRAGQLEVEAVAVIHVLDQR